jgi:hypothetical protein
MSSTLRDPVSTGEPLQRHALVVTTHDTDYTRTTAFVAAEYAAHFGARLRDFMPGFVVLREGKRICAAAGFRLAASGPLFLEQYLTDPIEAVLAREFASPVDRAGIVEIGQLAVASAAFLPDLFHQVATHLQDWGLRYAVCTGTRCLVRRLRAAGIRPLVIGEASPAHLAASGTEWGSYYRHAPSVLAGDIAQGIAQLRAHLARPGASTVASAGGARQ